MSSNVPVIKRIAWISIIPQFLIMGLILLIWYPFSPSNFVIYGAITYLLLSQLLRRNIAKDHLNGMAKVKQENFAAAIPHFENSYEFFKKHNWIDQYRYVTMLSSGQMTYKEMALVNIAFCYGQTGNGKMAKEYYQRALHEFPNSGIAKAGLKLLNARSEEV